MEMWLAEAIRTLRKSITSRGWLQFLPTTSASDMEDALNDALVAEWRRKSSQIPVRTGRLKRTLTNDDHPNLRVRVSGNVVEVDIEHPGALYHPSVVPKVNWRRVVQDALTTIRQQAQGRR